VIGRVRELVRYPVKSMAGVTSDVAPLGWYGLEGDRRFAFRRLLDESSFPWLSASRLPELLLYQPVGFDDSSKAPAPTHVRAPDGALLDLRGPELTGRVAAGLGRPVELMQLRQGIFDETPISVISRATIAGIGREAGLDLDPRRFRANLLLETDAQETFVEDAWVGRVLEFGDSDRRPAIAVTMRDLRCVMINFDPDTAEQEERIMRAVVRLSNNYAGVYATVFRTGTIRVGDAVRLG